MSDKSPEEFGRSSFDSERKRPPELRTSPQFYSEQEFRESPEPQQPKHLESLYNINEVSPTFQVEEQSLAQWTIRV